LWRVRRFMPIWRFLRCWRVFVPVGRDVM